MIPKFLFYLFSVMIFFVFLSEHMNKKFESHDFELSLLNNNFSMKCISNENKEIYKKIPKL